MNDQTLTDAVVLALSSSGVEASDFAHIVRDVSISHSNGKSFEGVYIGADRHGLLHLFQLEVDGRFIHEKCDLDSASFKIDGTSGWAHIEVIGTTGALVAGLHGTAAIALANSGEGRRIKVTLDDVPVTAISGKVYLSRPERSGVFVDPVECAFLLNEEGDLNVVINDLCFPANPTSSWSRSGDLAELLMVGPDYSPVVATVSASSGASIIARFKTQGPPERTSVLSGFRNDYWLEQIESEPHMPGRLCRFDEGPRLAAIGQDWSGPLPILLLKQVAASVDPSTGDLILLKQRDATLCRELGNAARRFAVDSAATLLSPACVMSDGSDHAWQVLRADQKGIVIDEHCLSFSELDAWVELTSEGASVLHASTPNVSSLAIALPDAIAREIWRRQETSVVAGTVSNRGVAERYDHYHEVARRRILFELFNDMLVIERELNRKGPIIDLIQRFQRADQETKGKVNKPLMEQVTDALVSLWLVMPNARRRVNELLFYYPYFLSEEQAKFDRPFLSSPPNMAVFDEGLAAQPVRGELSRVLLPMLQGLAELEASLAPIERILSESKIKNTLQYRASPFIPLVGQSIVAATALFTGSTLAFGMLGGAAVSSFAGQLMKSSLDDQTTWRQLTAAADRTLPAWIALSQKIPVLMAEADAVIRRLQSAGMQRTRKVLDASPYPMPEKRAALTAVLDEMISNETDAWFCEVDPEKGIYPALAASGLSKVTAQAARDVVKQAQQSFMKGSI